MPSDPGNDERFEHDAVAHRFTLSSGAAVAVLDYREHDSRALEYHHTFVPPAMRGHGVASRLVAHALRHALAQRLSVIPTCPFVAAFIRRHPEYTAVLHR
ncbi:MAG TPA: GNAT family N-acetyltransferase [Gammaproteobacteria bacterium]|nr:GNAT family N-acetyltransferase [Gammaproteobacteria bacterium]